MQSYEKEEFKISGSYKLTGKLTLVNDPRQQDLLARISLKFRTSDDNYFIISGITLRKHKSEYQKTAIKKYWIAFPRTNAFVFNSLSSKLKQEIESEIFHQYEDQSIPIIDNNLIKNKSP